jgi:hypothetical protein
MNFYTAIVIISAIIAICYLANLYAGINSRRSDLSKLVEFTRSSKESLRLLVAHINNIACYLKDMNKKGGD